MNLIHEEFLQTESQYIRDLEALSKLSEAVPAFGAAQSHMSAAIFQNVKDILECNRDFGARCMDDGGTVMQLARAFCVSSTEMVKVYRPYILNYQNALEVLSKHQGEENFDRVVHTFLKDMNRQSLPNLLIKPVQRITKYPLLIHQLLDQLSLSSDADLRSRLQQALDCALAVCQAVESETVNSPRLDPLIPKLFRSMHTGQSVLLRSARKISIHELGVPPSPPKQSPSSSATSSPHSKSSSPLTSTPSSPVMIKSRTEPNLSPLQLSPVNSEPNSPHHVAAPALRRSGGRRALREQLLKEAMRLTAELAHVHKELQDLI